MPDKSILNDNQKNEIIQSILEQGTLQKGKSGTNYIVISNPSEELISKARSCGIYVVNFEPKKWSFSLESNPLRTYKMKITRLNPGTYYGFTLFGKKGQFLLGNYIATHNTSTIKAIANVTGRHVINVRLSEVKTNTQLKNLFHNPVLQVQNPETLTIEKFTVPIHQRLYVIEDVDCMGDLIKKREYHTLLQPSLKIKNSKTDELLEPAKPSGKSKLAKYDFDDGDEELAEF